MEKIGSSGWRAEMEKSIGSCENATPDGASGATWFKIGRNDQVTPPWKKIKFAKTAKIWSPLSRPMAWLESTAPRPET